MGLGLRPGAKASDEPPMPYRLRASPRLYGWPSSPRAAARACRLSRRCRWARPCWSLAPGGNDAFFVLTALARGDVALAVGRDDILDIGC